MSRPKKPQSGDSFSNRPFDPSNPSGSDGVQSGGLIPDEALEEAYKKIYTGLPNQRLRLLFQTFVKTLMTRNSQ